MCDRHVILVMLMDGQYHGRRSFFLHKRYSMQKGLDFSVHTTQQRLSSLLAAAIDDAIGDEDIEVNGFKVKLRRIGDLSVSPLPRAVLLTLPFNVAMLRENGLFSVEGHGSLELDVQINFDINSTLKAHFQSDIKEVKWLEKPVLDLGILNIPMERLIGLIINHYESIITGKIDHKLKQVADLNQPLDLVSTMLAERLNQVDTKGVYPAIQVRDVVLAPIQRSGDDISVRGSIGLDIDLDTERKNHKAIPRSFSWMEEREGAVYQDIHMTLGYKKLARIIQSEMPSMIQGDKEVVFNNLDIHKRGDRLHIVADIEAPIRAVARVSGVPIASGCPVVSIDLDDIEIEVNPSNIIYKVAIPFMMGFIRKKVEDLLPVPLAGHMASLKRLGMKAVPDTLLMGQLEVDMKDLQLQELTFGSEGILAEARILEPRVAVTIR